MHDETNAPSVRLQAAGRFPVSIHPISDPDEGLLLFVLCNDGTIWRTAACSTMSEVAAWEQFPTLPQAHKEG